MYLHLGSILIQPLQMQLCHYYRQLALIGWTCEHACMIGIIDNLELLSISLVA